ncbi:hypothetical protein A2115_00540 [Candidatus Woesebacteria bacterium GWA1_41_8]|uniref:Uncharacterized protein n=1 Tax=Candidatus Woesebacteria bacterium GWA1_41_8 TaxID=1802471 RepID=A0A1F7WIK8_9BACT|nr:MAG: hypothetical protein A2115_00540 [Candidatus Woesebacteria bacterium GWA1_41_8]
MKQATYSSGALITGLLTSAAVWLYAISEWGLLFGLLFGWIPALIAGVIIGLLWPLAVVLIIVIVLWVHNQNVKSEERFAIVAQCVEQYRTKITDSKALYYFDNGYAIYKKPDGQWGQQNPMK